MTITELIEEADKSAHLPANSQMLLPLLVAVIKNQQRQIDRAKHPLGGLAVVLNSAASALSDMNTIAAELEDVKP